jgi:hypothetical protein
MKIYETSTEPYYEHGKHTSIQLTIFILIFLISTTGGIFLGKYALYSFFNKNLHGEIHKTAEEYVTTYIEAKGKDPKMQTTDPYFNWAIDLYKDTPSESRYWFNPFLIVFIESAFLGLLVAIFITTILPYEYGLMRQKVEREVSNIIDNIEYIKHGFHSTDGQKEIVKELLNLNSYNFQEYSKEIEFHSDDLRVLIKAIKWRESNIWEKILHFNSGIQVYMRFHFTAKYSNAVLGFVYIGAAFLIVIIGLRGLKFIPPNEPTYVMFALGMEFTMLVVYAITLIYSKQEEEMEMENKTREAAASTLGTELGDSREVEKLLRVFIKSDSKD